MFLFTETLKQFLENRGGDFSASINTFFGMIPNFVFQDDKVNIDFNFKDMFIHEHLYHEIGAETEELFEYYLERKLDDVVVEYAPKISIFMKYFDDSLMKRSVELKRSGDNTYTTTGDRETTGTNNDTQYVNPITKQTENLTVQDRTANDYNDSETNTSERKDKINETYERVYTIAGKTNADLLNEIMELKNIYLEALSKFNDLFMYVE